jgi:hypothetical protein
MANGCVSVSDFKKLEKKVNQLLVVHELDSELTPKEKKLLAKAKADIRSNKKGAFTEVP